MLVAQFLCVIALKVQHSISFTTANTHHVNLTQKQNDTGHTESSSALKKSKAVHDIMINESPSENSRTVKAQPGKIEELKQREEALTRLLLAVRTEKLNALRSRPLTIGIVGFGRFGQFIARAFTKYGRVVATSRSDYTELAKGMDVTYVKLSDPAAFLDQDLDVIVLATSIVSFEDTVRNLSTHIKAYIEKTANNRGPLIVDVLSVKEYPRQILLDLLPKESDILCTHPMFGPDSGKDGWNGLNFVYERTRIDGATSDPKRSKKSIEEDSDKNQSVSHVEGMDRIERFLSIWEEEGCRMVALSCKDHDSYAANSQFLTHLMGRILGEQGLKSTPIDTKGFENVLKLVETTTADSFDLFYGLYKYNQNSIDTIIKLRDSMDGVVKVLQDMEEKDS